MPDAEFVRYHAFPMRGVEAKTASTTRSFPRHTHDQYGIGIVDAGGHSSWSGRGQVEAGPGKFISVNPGEVHDGRAIGGKPRTWRILYFDPGVMDEARHDILAGSNREFTFSAPVFADDAMRRAFEDAFAHASVDTGNAMAAETALLRLVSQLTRHSTTTDRGDATAVAGIAAIRRRIDADPAAPLTLTGLAKEAGLSRFQLIRAFTKHTGLPPHAYILQQRIAFARRLIRARYGLAETAVLAGFFDQSHLTRCFARQFGVTPHCYRAFRGPDYENRPVTRQD